MDFPYLQEFLTVAIAHFFAVISPGPTQVMVIQQSLRFGKSIALWVALGTGLASLTHMILSLVGIGAVISQSLVAFTLLKFSGAAYLVFLGIKSWKQSAIEMNVSLPRSSSTQDLPFKGFKTGFLTHILNPKPVLFFLSLFSIVVSPETPLYMKAVYVGWITFVNITWFTAVGWIFSSKKARNALGNFGYWANRLTGSILIALGVKLALTKLH